MVRRKQQQQQEHQPEAAGGGAAAAPGDRNPGERDQSFKLADDSTDAVGAVVKSPAFWAYCEMLLMLSDKFKLMFDWFEGCDCHPHRVHLHKMSSRLELDRDSCPMQGRRGPQLACGEWKGVLTAFAELPSIDVLSVTQGLSESERNEILVAFRKGIHGDVKRWSQRVGAGFDHLNLKACIIFDPAFRNHCWYDSTSGSRCSDMFLLVQGRSHMAVWV